MTTIRPNLPPPPAPANPADAGRLAAQKAFFAIAQGTTPAVAQAAIVQPAVAKPVAASAPAAATRAAPPVNRTAQAPAEPPARPLRPGSLLDIRV